MVRWRRVGPVMVTSAPVTGSPLTASVTTPARVPTAPRGASLTAAYAFNRPCPQMLLLPGSPPQVRSSVSIAVRSRMSRVLWTSRRVASEADHISATTPATCGEAIEVPSRAL